MYESLAVGFLSRTAVTLSVMPVSVIKTRFESGRFGYSSQMQALSHIVRKEGFRGVKPNCYVLFDWCYDCMVYCRFLQRF